MAPENQQEKGPKTARVRALVSEAGGPKYEGGPDFVLQQGSVYELPAEEAAARVESGRAEYLEEGDPAKVEAAYVAPPENTSRSRPRPKPAA